MRVIVVGGGSAGWITAATLQARLNGAGRGPLHITVVESPDTPPIGVGEATIPTFRTMLRRFGLSETAFLRTCNATFKHAIQFEDWSGPGSSYLHPFHRFQGPAVANAVAQWLSSDGVRPFSDLVSAQGEMIAQNLVPRQLDAPDYDGVVPYAYHLDADKFAHFLAQDLVSKGVIQKQAHVAKVHRGADGFVEKLELKEGPDLAADLYIDCTGQRAILSPPDDWVSYAGQLLCDRAVTMRVPETDDDYAPATVTTARASEAGWMWDIGLQNRRGRGYVYSSNHCEPEQAEAALRQDEGAKSEGVEARHIAFKSGRRAHPWSGNVVAMGLAGGFLEPLESTGLYLADYAARVLVEMFPPVPDPTKMRPLATRFNQLMGEMFDELADFLTLHYAVAGRRDTPFWRDASDVARHSERLANLLEIWSLRPPSFADFSNRYTPFSHQSYEFILLGSGWRPAGVGRGLDPLVLSPALELERNRIRSQSVLEQKSYFAAGWG